jgi:hypothetical protein
MTAEAQRVAIAEYLGAKWWPSPINPEQSLLAFEEPTKEQAIYLLGRAVWELVPDYLNDLNAMHDAEKVLTREQYQQYWHAVNHIAMGTVWTLRATAAQRAEAFLRTIGKWEAAK